MKKIKRIWNFVRFAIVNRKESELERGGFRFIFRKYSLDVVTLSRNFSVRILCSEHPYGYLKASVLHDNLGNLDGYATLMYILGTNLTSEQKLVSDVTRDVKSYFSRLEREAAKEAKNAKKYDENEELAELVALRNENAAIKRK